MGSIYKRIESGYVDVVFFRRLSKIHTCWGVFVSFHCSNKFDLFMLVVVVVFFDEWLRVFSACV